MDIELYQIIIKKDENITITIDINYKSKLYHDKNLYQPQLIKMYINHK